MRLWNSGRCLAMPRFRGSVGCPAAVKANPNSGLYVDWVSVGRELGPSPARLLAVRQRPTRTAAAIESFSSSSLVVKG